jgi:hypothetical protein
MLAAQKFRRDCRCYPRSARRNVMAITKIRFSPGIVPRRSRAICSRLQHRRPCRQLSIAQLPFRMAQATALILDSTLASFTAVHKIPTRSEVLRT